MTGFYETLTFFVWFLAFAVLPFILGVGLCQLLRVKEYGVRLGFVLFTIFLALLPFATKIVQDERYAYKSADNAWVSATEVEASTDPETKKPIEVGRDGKVVHRVLLRSDDVKRDGDHWLLVQAKEPSDEDEDEGLSKKKKKAKQEAEEKPAEKPIVVVNKTTFDISRWQQALSYGIDLAGGTNLIYELDESQAGSEPVDNQLMSRMVGAVTRRINPAGTKEIVVRQVGRLRIEVILPGADPAVVEETKELMTRLGTLEFSIVANRRDHANIIEAAERAKGTDVVVSGAVRAKWRPVAPKQDAQGRDIPSREFDGDPEIAVRQMANRPAGFKEILILYEPDENKQITGKLLKISRPTRDAQGRPAVGFQFNARGGFLFHELTTEYKPLRDGFHRRLAVMLNNEVFTAPSINSPIGDSGIIESSRFTEDEVQRLVNILNAGALPVPIKRDPISEFTISPTLGTDVQSKGKLALWVSSLAVILFMLGYYFVAGAVADFALLLNLLFIVSVMAFVKAAFTLPGLAGLVLSAGMAVDANVLIYERMREELARGASLRMAIHNGFDKAFAAIFDSNISTLITAVILYMIGTEQVKGFAVSLIIGLVMNLYTAVYVSRLVMNVLERSRLIKKLHMLSLVGVTNFDFVGKQVLASAASIVLIVAGLAAVWARGVSNFDIDFTGGVSVTMQFNEAQKTDDVREKLETRFGKNITVEELAPFGQTVKGVHFRLRVANDKQQEIAQKDVETGVNETFPGMLVKKLLSYEYVSSGKDEGKGKDEKPAAGAEGIEGGEEVRLKFTDEKGAPSDMAEATFTRYLEDQFATIKGPDGESPKYSKSEALFKLEGTAGKGLSSGEGKVRTYSTMLMHVGPAVARADLDQVLAGIKSELLNTPVFDEVTTFESSVAGETETAAILAVLAALVAIVVYVWFRFENLIFGLAAVVALAHDVLVSLGCVALGAYLSNTMVGQVLLLSDFKINMPMIAAFLTIVGYSLNDTIVIFDRLREVRGKNPLVNKEMINSTVNQTLSRTLLTAFTVFITVVILYALGGEGIHGFAFCMVVGSIAGTYSTVYIASPLVLVFMKHMRPKHGAGAVSRQPAVT